MTSLADERAAFEKFHVKLFDLTKRAFGEERYVHEFVQTLWNGWQARAASIQASPIPEPPVAWLCANPSYPDVGHQKYLVIADDTHNAIRGLVGAFPVFGLATPELGEDK